MTNPPLVVPSNVLANLPRQSSRARRPWVGGAKFESINPSSLTLAHPNFVHFMLRIWHAGQYHGALRPVMRSVQCYADRASCIQRRLPPIGALSPPGSATPCGGSSAGRPGSSKPRAGPLQDQMMPWQSARASFRRGRLDERLRFAPVPGPSALLLDSIGAVWWKWCYRPTDRRRP